MSEKSTVVIKVKKTLNDGTAGVKNDTTFFMIYVRRPSSTISIPLF